jgi:outer membrane protein assembly factor BamE
MRQLAALLACAALSGCGFAFVHKIDIQQGNVVTPQQVAGLKKGMTKAEVRQLLGTPLLTDVFHGERWDYYFSLTRRGTLEERTTLAVTFENERLAAWTGDVPTVNLPVLGPSSRRPSAVSVPSEEEMRAPLPTSASPPLR